MKKLHGNGSIITAGDGDGLVSCELFIQLAVMHG